MKHLKTAFWNYYSLTSTFMGQLVQNYINNMPKNENHATTDFVHCLVESEIVNM